MATGKGKKKQEVLDYNAQVRTLREQGPGRLYLLWGREDYLREQYLIELKSSACPAGRTTSATTGLTAPSSTFRRWRTRWTRCRFCPSARSSRCAALTRTSAARKMRRRSSRSSATCPDYCTLVFVMGTDFEPDGRLKTTKAFKKYGQLIQFTAQGEPALVKWVGKRFAAHKKRISSEDARQLIFFTGGLMNTMIPEIEKIAAYVQGDTVTRADILAVAHRMPEAVAYELTDRAGRSGL